MKTYPTTTIEWKNLTAKVRACPFCGEPLEKFDYYGKVESEDHRICVRDNESFTDGDLQHGVARDSDGDLWIWEAEHDYETVKTYIRPISSEDLLQMISDCSSQLAVMLASNNRTRFFVCG